jgi:hypothetical protein
MGYHNEGNPVRQNREQVGIGCKCADDILDIHHLQDQNRDHNLGKLQFASTIVPEQQILPFWRSSFVESLEVLNIVDI